MEQVNSLRRKRCSFVRHRQAPLGEWLEEEFTSAAEEPSARIRSARREP